MDQLRKVRNLRQKVGRKIYDVFKESLGLPVQLTALLGGGAKHGKCVVSPAKVEGLQQKCDVVVQKIV